MNIVFKFAIPAIACVMLSACVTSQSYADPKYHTSDYDQIQRLSSPLPVSVDAQFERNGVAYPAVDAKLREVVERTLRASGAFVVSEDSANAAKVHVVANNMADIDSARSKGFRTGLTFGVSGSTVADYYEFKFSYRDADGKERENSYRHAIQTNMGDVAIPASATPTTPAAAFEKVVEDVTLNFVNDLQHPGASVANGG